MKMLKKRLLHSWHLDWRHALTRKKISSEDKLKKNGEKKEEKWAQMPMIMIPKKKDRYKLTKMQLQEKIRIVRSTEIHYSTH